MRSQKSGENTEIAHKVGKVNYFLKSMTLPTFIPENRKEGNLGQLESLVVV